MKPFGYVRLSRLDADTTSPARQREVIAQLCAARGWEAAEVFEDLDVSGGKESRRGLDAMLARLGEVDAVVTWKLDRLARSLPHLLKLADTFEHAGVQLVTADGEVDTTSAAGRAFYGMRGVFAEFERNTVAERSRNMHAFLKAKGRVQSRVPYGWRKGEDGRFEPVEAKQANLRDWAERVAGGESLRAVARSANLEHTSLRWMLRSQRVLSALPEPLAARLRAELRRKADGFRPGSRSLLGGIARCSVCASPLRHSLRSGRPVYACKDAGHVYVDAAWADEVAAELLFEVLGAGALVPPSTRGPGSRRPERSPASIEARIEGLEDEFDRGLVERARYLARKERLMAQLAEARSAAEAPPAMELPSWDDWERMSHAEKRQALRSLPLQVEFRPVAPGTPRGRHAAGRIGLKATKDEWVSVFLEARRWEALVDQYERRVAGAG